MSRRSLLNVTSRKKRDTMLTYSYIRGQDPNGLEPSATFNTVLMSGGAANTDPYVIPWIATARNMEAFVGTDGMVADEATRTATHCYMRGLSERINMQTNSGVPWQWRRICFTFKGTTLINTNTNTFGAFFPGTTSAGYVRQARSMRSSGNGKTPFYALLFKGEAAKDWADVMTARVDNNLFQIKYDKIQTVRSGNATGVMTTRKLWFPMNATLNYADDQTGGDTSEAQLASPGTQGMGDYYVVDFFRPSTTATSADQMSVNYEAQLYWHER